MNVHCSTRKIRKRKQPTLSNKIDMIRAFESGVRRSILCSRYGLASSTVSTIIATKDKLLREWTHIRTVGGINRKRIRRTKFDEVEKALEVWLIQQVKCNKLNNDQEISVDKLADTDYQSQFPISLSNSDLQEAAKEIGESLGVKNFFCTPNFIQRFKKRHQFYFGNNLTKSTLQYLENTQVNSFEDIQNNCESTTSNLQQHFSDTNDNCIELHENSIDIISIKSDESSTDMYNSVVITSSFTNNNSESLTTQSHIDTGFNSHDELQISSSFGCPKLQTSVKDPELSKNNWKSPSDNVQHSTRPENFSYPNVPQKIHEYSFHNFHSPSLSNSVWLSTQSNSCANGSSTSVQSNSCGNTPTILDVISSLAVIRRFCETQQIDTGSLIQLEKSIAKHELETMLHR